MVYRYSVEKFLNIQILYYFSRVIIIYFCFKEYNIFCKEWKKKKKKKLCDNTIVQFHTTI